MIRSRILRACIEAVKFGRIRHGIDVTGSVDVINLVRLGHSGEPLTADTVELPSRLHYHHIDIVDLAAENPVEVPGEIPITPAGVDTETSGMTRHEFRNLGDIIKIDHSAAVYILEFGTSREGSLARRHLERMILGGGDSFGDIRHSGLEGIDSCRRVVIEISSGIPAVAPETTYKPDRPADLKHIVIDRDSG